MKIANSLYFSILLTVLVFSACKPFDPDTNTPPKEVEGWAPVYAQNTDIIKATDPQPVEHGGKIYIKGSRLYQVESGAGIHVIDISQPENPVKLKFIQVAGCQEIAINGTILYTNNVNDMVSIKIADLNNIAETDRKKDAFHIVDKNHPPAKGWFECIDASKGDVIGWENKTLNYPKCLY